MELFYEEYCEGCKKCLKNEEKQRGGILGWIGWILRFSEKSKGKKIFWNKRPPHSFKRSKIG
jgi:hypothetical protein